MEQVARLRPPGDRPDGAATSGHLFNGNFGYSYKQGQSVAALFKEDFGRSAYLSGAALVLSLLIAIPIGIAQAVKRNSIGDYAATTLTFTLYSMPSFFLGLILIQFFALDIHIFPPEVSDNVQRCGRRSSILAS